MYSTILHYHLSRYSKHMRKYVIDKIDGDTDYYEHLHPQQF